MIQRYFPYFSLWARWVTWNRKRVHAERVRLDKIRCGSMGHRQLAGVWSEAEQRHIAYCLECETLLPHMQVPNHFREMTHEQQW